MTAPKEATGDEADPRQSRKTLDSTVIKMSHWFRPLYPVSGPLFTDSYPYSADSYPYSPGFETGSLNSELNSLNSIHQVQNPTTSRFPVSIHLISNLTPWTSDLISWILNLFSLDSKSNPKCSESYSPYSFPTYSLDSGCHYMLVIWTPLSGFWDSEFPS